MREQDTLVSADLARERRWPAWAARVYDELGVGSMMSILVHNDALSQIWRNWLFIAQPFGRAERGPGTLASEP